MTDPGHASARGFGAAASPGPGDRSGVEGNAPVGFQETVPVLFDLSFMGYAQGRPKERTGIFRAVDHLLKNLAGNGGCRLEFCAPQSVEIHYSALDYIGATEEIRGIGMRHSRWRRAVRGLVEAAYRNADLARGPRRLWWRGLKRVVRSWTVSGPLLAFDPVPQRSLERARVFHTPFRGIPAEVRACRRIAKFTTVYDLIPLLLPRHFGLETAAEHFLTESIDAIAADDWTLCISEHTKADLCHYRPDLDPSRIIVTQLAASDLFRPCQEPSEIGRVRSRYKIPEGPYLLSLCTLEPRKNLAHLIRCFRELFLQEKLQDLHLVLAGSLGWEYEAILAEIAGVDPRLRSRIVLTGRVQDEDMSPLYSGAVAFVFPSLYEGFGLPPLEAMQCGTPVICSDASSLPEVMGDAGLLVSPTDPDALCQAILRAHGSGELRKELARRGIERARLFSWKRCAAETIAAYRRAQDGNEG